MTGKTRPVRYPYPYKPGTIRSHPIPNTSLLTAVTDPVTACSPNSFKARLSGGQLPRFFGLVVPWCTRSGPIALWHLWQRLIMTTIGSSGCHWSMPGSIRDSAQNDVREFGSLRNRGCHLTRAGGLVGLSEHL
jgi:hypothetical protein